MTEPRRGGPRQEYLDAFDEDSVFSPRSRAPAPSDAADAPSAAAEDDEAEPADGAPQPHRAKKRGKGRALAGIVAAAVTTVLAVVVTGQFTGRDGDSQAKGPAGSERDRQDPPSRSDHRPPPADGKPDAEPEAPPKPQTYDEKMARVYPLDADLDGSGKFDAVPGFDKAPGRGQLFRYRVDVEQGLGLDARLFATAIQKTLNDDRSWAHDGGRTFERVSSGEADFVITLASPGTTADWCAKSGLDTTQDNVSCDSAATERVMINAFRWARGAETFGDKLIHPYRQMLINHEIGHRLGFNHVTCSRDGALAPVMQQQTKFLSYDGVSCKPNAWVYPNS